MIKEIANSEGNAFVQRLNAQIAQYNKLAKKPVTNAYACIALLQQIHFMHEFISRKLVDDEKFRASFGDVAAFKGVRTELELFGIPKADSSRAISDALSQRLGAERGIPAVKQWAVIANLNNRLFDFMPDIQQLNDLKKKWLHQPSELTTKEYLYALKTLKQKLLYELAFQDSDSLDIYELNNVTLSSLIGDISLEALFIEEQLHKDKTQDIAPSITQTAIYQELISLPPEAMDSLIHLLRNLDANISGSPTNLAIVKILPALANCEIVLLSSGNNIIYKIKDRPTQTEMVFQIGATVDNQLFLGEMEYSLVNEYLAPQIFSSIVPIHHNDALSITPFYSGGDLRSQREKLPSNTPPQAILKSAITTVSKLTAMCDTFAKSGAIYSDIKLSNFLTTNDESIIIPDKKSIQKMNEAGKISAQGLLFSPTNKPPELDNISKKLTSSLRNFQKTRTIHADAVAKQKTLAQALKKAESEAQASPKELSALRKELENAQKEANNAFKKFKDAEADYLSIRDNKTESGAAVMTYQLGLALYEYITLPANPKAATDAIWSRQSPLDYSHPAFKTPEGVKIQKLITDMTHSNPSKRPSLAQVQKQLDKLLLEPGLENRQMQSASTSKLSQIAISRRYSSEIQALKSQDNKDLLIQNELQKKYQVDSADSTDIKGTIKLKIFSSFQNEINEVQSMDELKALKNKLKDSKEYTFLGDDSKFVDELFTIQETEIKDLDSSSTMNLR